MLWQTIGGHVLKDFDTDIGQLEQLLEKSHSTVVFTGAGISTMSGIPDFRGAHGVYTDPWHGMQVEQVLDISFFHTHPEIFYAWAKDVWYHLEDYQPNIVHTVLAKLENKGYVQGIFTQNIDMLHTRAGSKKVYEVHGSARHHACTNCGKYYSYAQVAPIVREGKVPRCEACGGVIKPDIVLYGEALDSSILTRAYEMFSACDLCLILGSSMTVQPAASFPSYVRHGKIVIVNAQPTYYDRVAALRFTDLVEVFDKLDTFAEKLTPKKQLED